MTTIRKHELIAEIARAMPPTEGMNRHQITSAVVEQFMVRIRMHIKLDHQVTMRGFGSFQPKVQPPKVARIMKPDGTSVPHPIPARTIVKFKPSAFFFQP